MIKARSNSILWAGAAISLCGLAAYSNSFSGPFAFDDGPSIADNPTIRHLWDLKAVLSPPSGGYTVSGRPVLNLSFAINYALGGTNVWGYHAVNLLIHVCAGLALFGIVRRTLERRGTAIAFATALLWTLHPLQTESVTYIVQRAESLMGLFYLLTIYCFIRYVEGEKAASCRFYFGPRPWVRGRRDGSSRPEAAGEPPPAPHGGAATASVPPAGGEKAAGGRFYPGLWAGLSIAACLLGMATKEVMVSAPVIVLLYDRTFIAGTFAAAWRRRWKYYAGLALTWILLAWLVAGTGARGHTAGVDAEVSLTSYWLTQFHAIAHYLRLATWPHPLVVDYGTDVIHDAGAVFPAILVVAGLALGTAWALRRRPALGFAGAMFFAVLAPTALVPVTSQVMAEHRMYLALAPVAAAIVVAAFGRFQRGALLVCLAAAAALGCVTVRRNGDYRTALALWGGTAAVAPDNPRAHFNYGVALSNTGSLEAATAQYQEAVRLQPKYTEAQNNLGIALAAAGRWDEAIAAYERAVSLEPGVGRTRYNLGNAFLQVGNLPAAIASYEQAAQFSPDNPDVYYNLAITLNRAGHPAEAIPAYERALALKPDDAEARDNLGEALAATGQWPEAIARYESVPADNPEYPKARYHLAGALLHLGRTDAAIAAYRAALRARPDYPDARNDLSFVLSQLGRGTP